MFPHHPLGVMRLRVQPAYTLRAIFVFGFRSAARCPSLPIRVYTGAVLCKLRLRIYLHTT